MDKYYVLIYVHNGYLIHKWFKTWISASKFHCDVRIQCGENVCDFHMYNQDGFQLF